MTLSIRRSRPTIYENQISLIKFEFLKIIHVPITFSRLTNTDTRICTGTFMLNGQKIAQNSKLEDYISGSNTVFLFFKLISSAKHLEYCQARVATSTYSKGK